MSIYYRDDRVTLHHGDCIEVMASLPDASVDAVVADPPYALGFMGRSWDTFGDVGRSAQARVQRSGEVTPGGEGHSTSAGPYIASGVDSLRSAGAPFQAWCEQWAREALRVLEPFAGSGTTVEACLLEGFHCIAIEKTGEYLPLTVARIYRQRHPVEAVKLAGEELGLFAHIDEEVTG